MVGAKQVMPGPHLDPLSLLDLFEREKVTMSAGVPTIWLGMMQTLEANPGRWKLMPGLRLVIGGAAAPESMIRAMEKHNIVPLHSWGMTEMTPLGTVARLKSTLADRSDDERYATLSKQGIPGVLVDVRAESEQGIVPWDGHTMGELEVRGPHIAAAYYNPETPS